MGWRDGLHGDGLQEGTRRDDGPPGDGDAAAFRLLLDRWFDACVDVAWHVLYDVDAAAGVATETFSAAWQRQVAQRPPEEARTWLLGTARQRALGRRSQRGSGAGGHGLRLGAPGPGHEDGTELAWVVAAALGESDASLLALHLRHGLDVAAIAEVLAASPNDARELLLGLKRRLGGAVRAWSTWPRGLPDDPRCPDLRRELEAAGVTEFGPEAVRVLTRHSAACPACRDARRGAGSPEALLARVPIVPAGSVLAAEAVAALAAEGIPVGGGGAGLSAPPREPGVAATVVRQPVPATVTDPRSRSLVDPGDRRRLVVVGLAALLVAAASLAVARGGSSSLDEARTAAERAAATTTSAPPPTTTVTSVPPAGAAPPTSAPPAPTVTAGPVDPMAAEGTTTTGPPYAGPPLTTAPSMAAAPAAPPLITVFAPSGRGLGTPCDADQVRITFVWETTGADTVTVTGPGAPGGGLPPAGSATACREQGEPVSYTLSATGAGGTVTRTTTA